MQYTIKPAVYSAIAADLPTNLKNAFILKLIIEDYSFVTKGIVSVEIYHKADPTRYAFVGTATIDKAKDFAGQIASYVRDQKTELEAMIERLAILNTIADRS